MPPRALLIIIIAVTFFSLAADTSAQTVAPAPVFKDILAGLKTFCQREGISVLFDLRNDKPGDKLAPYDLPLPADAPDVTAAFVSAFNKGTL